jgi:hypothetical protein
MNRTHPVLSRRGIVPGTNAPYTPSTTDPRAESPRSAARSELVDRLPSLLTVSGGISSVLIQSGDGADQVGIRTNDAWGIKLVEVNPDTFGQEVWVNGLTVEQLPTDPDGLAGASDAIKWGDRWGRSACIVATMNVPGILLADVPFTLGPGSSWGQYANYSVPLADPSWCSSDVINGWASGNNGVYPDLGTGSVLWRVGFPAGKVADAAVFRRVLTKGFGALGARVGNGNIFNVWLVLRREFFPGTDPAVNPILGTLNGHVDVQAHCAPTRATDGFSEATGA